MIIMTRFVLLLGLFFDPITFDFSKRNI